LIHHDSKLHVNNGQADSIHAFNDCHQLIPATLTLLVTPSMLHLNKNAN